jgi:tetratricopeptide (TPR) repeat protein
VDGRRLGQQLRGELDWIVMRALEKDRNRRYESASTLAADVQRYLGDEPVLACPASVAYRFRKFARRNKVMLGTAAAVAVALLLGLGISIWQAVEADRARGLANTRLEKETQAHVEADRQRQRAQDSYRQAVDAVKKMIEAGDERLAEIPQTQVIRERLLEDAVALYTKLIKLNPGDAETYFARAHVYRLTAKYKEERADLEKAIELDPTKGQYHHVMAFALQYSPRLTDADRRRSLFHQKRAAELLPAQDAHEAWALFYLRTGQTDKAIAEYRKMAEAAQGSCLAYVALAEIARIKDDHREECVNREKAIKAIEQGLVGRMTDDTWLWRCFAANPIPTALAWQHIRLAQALGAQQEDRQALTVLNRCLELTGVSGHPRGEAHRERAEIYISQQKFESALTDYDEGLRLNPEAHDFGHWYRRRGTIHFALRHYELALADFAKAVSLEPDSVSDNLNVIPPELVAACPDENFRKGMLELAARTIALLEGKPATSHRGKASAYKSRARLLEAMKQPELARADLVRSFELYQQELAQQKATLGPEHADTLETMRHLVLTGTQIGQSDRAASVLNDLLARLKRNDVPRVEHGQLAAIGHTLLEVQKYAAAEGVLRECLAIREKQLPESWLRFNAASMLGGALLGQKKEYKEAELLLLEGYAGLKKHEATIPPQVRPIRLAEAVDRLVQFYVATGQEEKARAWREKLKAKVE